MNIDPYQHSTSSSSDYVYYDLQIANLKSDLQDDNSQHLKFFETRQVPIIEKANDYHMSIVRFQIDTFSLPVYIAEIEPNQAEADKTILSFTFVYTSKLGVKQEYRHFMYWKPYDLTKQKPPAPSVNQNGLQSISPYYYCYNYHHLVDLLNDTLNYCAYNIYLTNPNDPDKQKIIQYPPFVVWNNDSNTFSFIGIEKLYGMSYTESDSYGNMSVYMNNNMFALLNGFSIKKYGVSASNGKNYELLINRYRGFNIIPGDSAKYGHTERQVIVNQEYSNIAVLSPVSAIVFASATLPVTPNQLSAPYIYQDGQLVQLSSVATQTLNIITDMATDEQSYKPSLLFVPSGEFRYLNLYNNGAINQIDISCYWRDKTSRHHPLVIPSGASCSLKILFKKKYI